MEPSNANVEAEWPEEIRFFCMRSLMYYHMTYHHTFSIHINHAILLHLYLFGLFLILVAVHKIMAIVFMVIYCSLFIVIFRGNIIGWLYTIIIFAIGFLAYFIFESYLKPSYFDVKYNVGIPYIIGACCILFALLLQQLGHTIFERFLPPISLYHGFIAAPFLEFMTYFVLLDCKKLIPSKLDGLQQAITYKRQQLTRLNKLNSCYHCS